MVIKIKIVQTELYEEEYELLKEFVDSKGITMKEGLIEDGIHGAVKQAFKEVPADISDYAHRRGEGLHGIRVAGDGR
jgi:hypothetical protein